MPTDQELQTSKIPLVTSPSIPSHQSQICCAMSSDLSCWRPLGHSQSRFLHLGIPQFPVTADLSKTQLVQLTPRMGFFIMAEVFPDAKLAGFPWMTYLFFWCPFWKPIWCKWPDFCDHASKPWISWIENSKTGTWYHAELRIFEEIAIPKFHLKCHGGVTYMHDFWLLNHHFHVRMASLQEWNTAIWKLAKWSNCKWWIESKPYLMRG